MNLTTFLSAIHGTGRLSVGRDFVVSHDGCERLLRELDEAVRCDAPAGLPDLDVVAATWAIERVHAACVLPAHRDLATGEIERHLDAVACPGDARLPSTHYSVDLTMRHLPELWRLARGLAQDHALADSKQQEYVHGKPWAIVPTPDPSEVVFLGRETVTRVRVVGQALPPRHGGRAATPLRPAVPRALLAASVPGR